MDTRIVCNSSHEFISFNCFYHSNFPLVSCVDFSPTEFGFYFWYSNGINIRYLSFITHFVFCQALVFFFSRRHEYYKNNIWLNFLLLPVISFTFFYGFSFECFFCFFLFYFQFVCPATIRRFQLMCVLVINGAAKFNINT